MNDFERQLSHQPLRQPPAGWRAQILVATEKIAATPAWTWRDWFWPSPHAWGALAAVWVGVFFLGGTSAPSSAPAPANAVVTFAAPTPLYAFTPHRDLTTLLDPLN